MIVNRRPCLPKREPVAAVATWDIEKDESPYPGSMHFTRKHTRVFFGRDVEIR